MAYNRQNSRDGDKDKNGAQAGAMRRSMFRRPKSCPFSGDNAPVIDYKDVALLERYVSERGKIVPSRIGTVLIYLQVTLGIQV